MDIIGSNKIVLFNFIRKKKAIDGLNLKIKNNNDHL
jgi:hypothetical protein